MGLLDSLLDKEKTSKVSLANPRDVFNDVLKQLSGSGQVRELKYNIFYQIIAFRGVVDGLGCSTLVANVAMCLADLGLNICVVDTNIKAPTQDILLKTDYKESVSEDKRMDWFDMPFSKASVLHVSKRSPKISVLSFYGKDRGIVDALSINDSEELVSTAFSVLHTKFDLILVDSCHEMTNINAAALQQSQHVIQIWNDSPLVTRNIDGFIDDCAAICCPLDKMHNVVYSKVMDDIMGNIDEILAQYKLKKLASNPFSKDIARVGVLDKNMLYQYPENNPDIIAYTDCVIAIACHICNIPLDGSEHGKDLITSSAIVNGEVDGTVYQRLRDESNSALRVKVTDESGNRIIKDDYDLSEDFEETEVTENINDVSDETSETTEDQTKGKKKLFGRKGK